MTPGRPKGIGAPLPRLIALWAALAVGAPGRASAGEPETASGPVDATLPQGPAPGGPSDRAWISVGLIAGTTQFDAKLADYQWDTTPRAGWGVRALVGRGPLACGLRAWRASTTQSIGDLGEPPDVHATSWELIGEGGLIEVMGTRVLATGSAGRLHLGYQPDRITIQPPGTSPIVVDLEPVGAWIVGGGLMLRRAVAAAWTVGLGAEVRMFSIDTSHRAGDVIVQAREALGDWSARFELARRVGWP
jgi:hypothetical protein